MLKKHFVNFTKKAFALGLAVLFAVSLLPQSAFATENLDKPILKVPNGKTVIVNNPWLWSQEDKVAVKALIKEANQDIDLEGLIIENDGTIKAPENANYTVPYGMNEKKNQRQLGGTPTLGNLQTVPYSVLVSPNTNLTQIIMVTDDPLRPGKTIFVKLKQGESFDEFNDKFYDTYNFADQLPAEMRYAVLNTAVQNAKNEGFNVRYQNFSALHPHGVDTWKDGNIITYAKDGATMFVDETSMSKSMGSNIGYLVPNDGHTPEYEPTKIEHNGIEPGDINYSLRQGLALIFMVTPEDMPIKDWATSEAGTSNVKGNPVTYSEGTTKEDRENMVKNAVTFSKQPTKIEVLPSTPTPEKATNGTPTTVKVLVTYADDSTETVDIPVTVTVEPTPSFVVTYKVVNGNWADGNHFDKFENVVQGGTPASVPNGMTALDGYNQAGGSWDVDPATATINENKTFTYTFPQVGAEHTVKFVVQNGTWQGGGTEEKTIKVADGTKIPSDQIPEHMQANAGFENGTWDENPADAVIGADKTFTYTFAPQPPPFQSSTVTYVEGEIDENQLKEKIKAAISTQTAGVTIDSISYDNDSIDVDGTPKKAWELPAKDGNYNFPVKVNFTQNGQTGTATLDVDIKVTKPEYTVIYKVVNGTWDNNSDKADKTEKVLKGELPKSVPTGMQPERGFQAPGTWADVADPANTPVNGNVTYTYTFPAEPTHSVTYKIENGTWENGTKDDIVKQNVVNGQQNPDVPQNMKPNEGFGPNGSWKAENPSGKVPSVDTIYTYTFEPKQQHDVTYKVENGTWADGQNGDITKKVTDGTTPTDIPTGMKPSAGFGPENAGTWTPSDPANDTITGPKTYTFTFPPLPKHQVTYEIENGTWQDGSSANKTEEVFDGGSPKDVPTGMQAKAGFTNGHWEEDPNGATINGNKTFKYVFDPAPAGTHTVTYNIVNGTFGGTDTTRTEQVANGAVPTNIPADMQANPGFGNGAWDNENIATTPINGDVTYTYTYQADPTPGTHKVTYKVQNGTWSNDTTTDIEETVNDGAVNPNVPTGMKPSPGFGPTGSWQAEDPTGKVANGDTVYTYVFDPAPATTYTVTYNVVNGKWDDNTTTPKTETVTAGQNPANVPSNMVADAGFAGGAWEPSDPETTAVNGNITFTYTFTPVAPTNHNITYKVVNGTWADDTNADITEVVANGSANANVPTGMKPNAGFGPAGSWSPIDPTGQVPTGDTVYTFTFTPVAPANHTVTYKVVGGTFGGTDTTRTEQVANGQVPANIPTDMQANPGFGPAGSWNVASIATDPVTGDVTYTYTFTPVAPANHTVTYKVVGGTFGGTDTTRTEQVANGQAPANIPTDMQANPGFGPAGSWNVPTIATDPVTGDVTYTYTFDPAVAPANHTVTYKVVNGTWADSTNADKTETVANGAAPNPPVGMLANLGFENGSWAPAIATTVTGDVVYTYTFTPVAPLPPAGEPFTVSPVRYHVNAKDMVELVKGGITSTSPAIAIVGMSVVSIDGTATAMLPNKVGSYRVTMLVNYTEGGVAKQANIIVPVSVYADHAPIKAPKTGDNVNLTLYAMLLVLSLAAATLALKKKKGTR